MSVDPKDKSNDAAAQFAWATLTAKVKSLEDAHGGVVAIIDKTQNQMSDMAINTRQNLEIIYHFIRTARNETRDQFQHSIMRAQNELNAPPEIDELVQLRAQMEKQRLELEELRTHVLMSSIELAPATTRKQRGKSAETPTASATIKQDASTRPNPANFAPAHVVAPPAIHGDDTDIPLREPEAHVPPMMRFDEGK